MHITRLCQRYAALYEYEYEYEKKEDRILFGVNMQDISSPIQQK